MIVRELFARLGLDVDSQSFETANNLLERARSGLMSLVRARSGLMSLGKIVAAGGLAVLTRQVAQTGANAQDASDRLGVSVETVQELGYAAKLSGTSFESLQQGLAFMARKGVKNLDQGLADLADRIAALPPGGERAAAAMEMLGRGGVELVPLLAEGSEGIARLRREAQDMGLVVDGVAVRRLAKLDDGFDRLTERLKGMRNRLVVQWIGPITKGLDLLERAIAGVSDALAVLAKNMDAVGVVFASFAGSYLVGLIAGLAAAAGGFGALAAAAASAAYATIAAWVAAAVPFLAIAAIIGSIILIVDDLWTSFTGGEGIILPTLKRLGQAFLDFFNWIGKKATEFGEAFVDAIMGPVKALVSFFTDIGQSLGRAGKAFSDAIVPSVQALDKSLGRFLNPPRAGPKDDGVPTIGPDGAHVSLDPAMRFGAGPKDDGVPTIGPDGAHVSLDPATRFGAAASPAASAAASPSRTTIGGQQFNASFVVNGAPGQDPQAIAGQVRDTLDQWHAAQMRQTYAAVGGG